MHAHPDHQKRVIQLPMCLYGMLTYPYCTGPKQSRPYLSPSGQSFPLGFRILFRGPVSSGGGAFPYRQELGVGLRHCYYYYVRPLRGWFVWWERWLSVWPFGLGGLVRFGACSLFCFHATHFPLLRFGSVSPNSSLVGSGRVWPFLATFVVQSFLGIWLGFK